MIKFGSVIGFVAYLAIFTTIATALVGNIPKTAHGVNTKDAGAPSNLMLMMQEDDAGNSDIGTGNRSRVTVSFSVTSTEWTKLPAKSA